MFDERFEVIFADTDLSRSLHYRIRYQVYCEELGYEDAERFPDGEERDRWDEHAAHFIVRDKQANRGIGAVRLVLPEADDFPIGAVCALDRGMAATIPSHRACEISRVCITSAYRRHNESAGQAGHSQRISAEPVILLGLLGALCRYGRARNLRYGYLLVRPALARLLGWFGIKLTAAGQACRHKGLRKPYLVDFEWAGLQAAAVSPNMRSMFKKPAPFIPYSALTREDQESALNAF